MRALRIGDCLEVLKTLEADSIDSCVTDPPYELGFMGKSWDSTGIAYNPDLWREVLRVLKPGAHLLSFGGTRTYHRMACAIEDAGFEIRDQIQWLYGSGFPKSHNLDGEHEGWGTALKPANEPIVVARKPLSEKTVAANVLKWGTGALNIAGCRIGSEIRFNAAANNKSGDVYDLGIANRTDVEGRECVGRWPANIILDEEAGKMLDEQSGLSTKPNKGVRGRGGSKYASGKGFANTLSVTGQEVGYDDFGGASRFFYCAKASKKDRGEGNNHPTVKPTSLMAYLCRLVTPPNGTVLDPFMGSGSTGRGAVIGGFGFVGIEREAEYLEIAKARIGELIP